MIPKSWWMFGIAGLVVLAFVPVIGHWLRSDRRARCAWDGLEITPAYRVRVIEKTGDDFEFCCLQCAESWLSRRQPHVAEILVTDEASGTEFEASEGNYVRSTIVTNRLTGESRHVFLRREDALSHAESANGRLLSGDERPFEIRPSSHEVKR